MKRKKKAVLSDEFVIAPETVRDFFERAVEERIDREQTRRPSEYVDGVAAALGWILGDYADDPLDAGKPSRIEERQP